MLEPATDSLRPDAQSVHTRGMDNSACATGRPPFIGLIADARNDPIAIFKQNPHQTTNAKNLAYHEAEKHLPSDFLQKELSPEGNKIRTLIGVIYKDVHDSGNAEDIAKLNEICKKLAEANSDESKERKVAKDLSRLVSNYGAAAFEKVINKYIEHCMDAWEIYHQTRSVDVRNKTIFTHCLDACKSTLKHNIEGLTQPDQPWETMAQNLNFFIHDCASISKTLTFYEAEPLAQAPKGGEARPDGPSGLERLERSGITLNITNKAGGVGNITHSVGAANTWPVDSNYATVKYILDSTLDNVDKVDLLKNLFNASSGRGSHFLDNLVGVQGVQQSPLQGNETKCAIATQTPEFDSQSIASRTEGEAKRNMAAAAEEEAVSSTAAREVENTQIEGEAALRGNKGQSVRASLSNTDFIYTTGRTIDWLSRRDPKPKHFVPFTSELTGLSGKQRRYIAGKTDYPTGRTTQTPEFGSQSIASRTEGEAKRNMAAVAEEEAVSSTAAREVENTQIVGDFSLHFRVQRGPGR